jgi:anti-sigma factor RsiW
MNPQEHAMDTHDSRSPVPDEALHALMDGRLSPAERTALEERLLHDLLATARLAAFREQREALRGLHRQVLGEAIPSPLMAAGQRLADAHERSGQWWRWSGMAASLLLVFAAGWLSHGQWGAPQPDLNALAARVPGSGPEFARQATVAHVVYAPEVRHPVEVTAAQQDHLVQWLSKRVGRPLKVPDLSALGYELVGGRLLPGEAGARAQFMYQAAGGERITLYLGAIDSPGSATAQETAFSFSNAGPVPGFYWVDRGFGYALAGKLPRERLMQIAQAVYLQL